MKASQVVAWCLLVVMVFLPGRHLVAQTTASLDGNMIKITVPIDVVGLEGETTYNRNKGAREPSTAAWERIAENRWNTVFREFKYRDCFTLELDLVVHSLPKGESRPIFADGQYVGSVPAREVNTHPGHHRIYLVPYSLSATNVTIVEGAESVTDDVVTPYLHEVEGGWTNNTWVVPHEIGHLMGLGDDEAGRHEYPFPWRLDRKLVVRVGDLLAQVMDVPRECHCWVGRFNIWGHHWLDPDPTLKHCGAFIDQEWAAEADVVVREGRRSYRGGGKSYSALEYRRIEAEITQTTRPRFCRGDPRNVESTFRRKGIIVPPTLDPGSRELLGGRERPVGWFGGIIGGITYAAKEDDFAAEQFGDQMPDRRPGQYTLRFPSLCAMSEEPWQYAGQYAGSDTFLVTFPVNCTYLFVAGSTSKICPYSDTPESCEGPRFLEDDLSRMAGTHKFSQVSSRVGDEEEHNDFKAEWNLERMPCAAVPRE